MNIFLFDGSALVKRYVAEPGKALVYHLFTRAARERLSCLMLGAGEVAAALVRKRNGGLISPADYSAAISEFRTEVLDAADFGKPPIDNNLIAASIPLLDKHAINATDAVVLQAAPQMIPTLRAVGNDLVLVACDRRLLRAAQAEGLLTFDPENQTQPELDSLLGP
jgi:predicted nucleic acid-binding protein